MKLKNKNMKINKKGFTLIELLAVIVVLAIIALIATPIVMNTIKNAKKGAAERTADNYIKQVETAVAEAKLGNNSIPNGTYDIDKNGNLTGAGLPNGKLEIDMSGNKPTSGKITISNGGVSQDGTTMTVGDYNVRYNQENNKYEATEKGNTSLICDLQEGTSQTIGAKYTCHLDSDRTFYVLETSGDNVSLIMDRNFADDTVSTVAWCIDGGSDGATCKNINSKEEGTPLKHIQDTFGENVTVSFPTKYQIYEAGGNQYRNLPTWIYDYLNSTPGEYWTSSYNSESSSLAWIVLGNVDAGVVLSNLPEVTGLFGLRPVITISKSKLN